MSGDDLAIFLFFLTCVLAFGLEAIKAETAFRRMSFGAIAAVCLLTGLFWLQIRETWPVLSTQMAAVATNPVSWFVVLMFMLCVFAFHRPKERSVHSPGLIETQKLDTGSKEPARAVASASPEERVFTRVTAAELAGLLADRTSVQAAVLANPHMNKWMRANGIVRDVTRWKDGETSVLLTDEGEITIAARFVGEHADQAAHLTKGSKISVVGFLNSIDYGIIRLLQCELT